MSEGFAAKQLPDPDEIGARVAAASTRVVSRYWYAEAKRIEELVDDPQARWEILTTALRRIGWPKTPRT